MERKKIIKKIVKGLCIVGLALGITASAACSANTKKRDNFAGSTSNNELTNSVDSISKNDITDEMKDEMILGKFSKEIVSVDDALKEISEKGYDSSYISGKDWIRFMPCEKEININFYIDNLSKENKKLLEDCIQEGNDIFSKINNNYKFKANFYDTTTKESNEGYCFNVCTKPANEMSVGGWLERGVSYKTSLGRFAKKGRIVLNENNFINEDSLYMTFMHEWLGHGIMGYEDVYNIKNFSVDTIMHSIANNISYNDIAVASCGLKKLGTTVNIDDAYQQTRGAKFINNLPEMIDLSEIQYAEYINERIQKLETIDTLYTIDSGSNCKNLQVVKNGKYTRVHYSFVDYSKEKTSMECVIKGNYVYLPKINEYLVSDGKNCYELYSITNESGENVLTQRTIPTKIITEEEFKKQINKLEDKLVSNEQNLTI